ncbi:type II secretion system F family protein [Desulfoluna butyratoxydans]|uniref:Type ii secretion system f domain n=1 Tax=Desulfoluna butyratoxydans TaxID=231438 RepID=A0A4U8YXI7_9BACT|nr:type II secretion system F family protein [Desulfoluna butyratoxydans]VFQ46173.1 type ii secretion system f domain [Desulfoluna butyratoxydans]
MSLWIPVLLVDAGLFALAFHFFKTDRKRGKTRTLIRALKKEPSPSASHAPALKNSPRKIAAEELVSALFDLSRLESILVTAGVTTSPERFVLWAAGAGVLLFLPLLLITRQLAVATLLAGTGMALPFGVVIWKKRQRERRLVEQLPDALDMIVRSLKVGHSVDGALKEAGRSFPNPLGQEVTLIYEEIAMGLPFKQAINHLEERFADVPDIRIFCAAFILQRETGGNLAAILSGLSTTIRERFQLERQIKAHSSEGRLSALVIGLLPPVFGLVTWLLNPGYIRTLVTHPTGQHLLVAAVLFEITGFVVMRAMTKLDV